MVLVVDDHEDIRDLMVSLLQMEGYETIVAASGMEALEQVRAHRPHGVILDFHMPGMNGLEVLRIIRADVDLATTAVILYSACGHELRRLAMSEGANAYVQKGSLDFGELRRELLRWCGPRRQPSPLSPSEPPAARAAG